MRRFVLASLVCSALSIVACGGARESSDEEAEGALVTSTVDVVFSPATGSDTHTARIAKMIDGAQRSVDIAIYSFSDADISRSLEAAVQRGVKVRIVYEGGGSDSRLTGDAKKNSKSGRLESKGMDVRFVNKIMHHKFVLVDGPRDDASKAASTKIASGSANWSASAVKTFDENTLFIEQAPGLAQKLQREFDLMWSHTRDFALETPIAQELSSVSLPDPIPADVGIDAYFTSGNFKVKGTTFSSVGTNVAADALVKAIKGAQHSIHVASGHLRSRPVALALMEKAKASPGLDIRVYLDGQEYISAEGDADQQSSLQGCLAAAGNNESKQRACTDKGFLYGYEVGAAGAKVRYKTYAYRWDNSYAKQMHNKFFVIDGSTVFSGSYNLSDNAEHDTFENILVFRGAEHAALVSAFEHKFDQLWETGRDKKASVEQAISNASWIPLVFDSMALTHDEVTALKDLVRENCPSADTTEFRKNPTQHQRCLRSGANPAPAGAGGGTPDPVTPDDNGG